MFLDRSLARPAGDAINEGFDDDMGRWAVTDGANEMFVVESRPGGMVSLDIDSPPLVVTRARAEQIRTFIGAAIADTPAGPSS